jgi:hypothetical protein
MKPMTQPGTHPDAEILTAFAEQLTTAEERDEILAHMAECSRCREVIFLAQQAVEEEKPAGPAALVSTSKAHTSWFTAWKWSWIPVAALAGVVGFAVVRHVNRTSDSETRMAQALATAEVVQSSPATKAPTSEPEEQQPSRPSNGRVKQKQAERERSDRDAGVDRKSLDERDELVARKKDEAAKEADQMSAAPKDSGGSTNGVLGGRAKTSGVGGPMAQNQAQQQNSSKLQPNYANEDRQANVLADSANKPVTSRIGPESSSQTVTVQAPGGQVPVTPAPSPAPPVSTAQMESAMVSAGNLEKRKAAYPVLPSKLAMISEATSAERTIAIDTAGSLFLSQHGGKRWQPVSPQWAGRAVAVKVVEPVIGEVGGLLKQSIARFELTTDKQETWVSDDGKTWTLQKAAGK